MIQSSPSTGNIHQPSLKAFADQFAEIPASWLSRIACEPIQLPMWDTLFLVNNPDHDNAIKALFRDLEQDSDCDDCGLSDHWFAVADTGFVGCDVEDRIFLGVDGAGYCFYKAHWEPLFKLILNS